jgi:hypothetical protein
MSFKERPALYGNKITQVLVSIIQWVPGALSLGVKRPGRESDHSPPSNADVNALLRENIKMRTLHVPFTGKPFIGNALCSSDDPVTQLIHILNSFFALNNVLYKLPEERKIQRSQIWRMSGQGMDPPFRIQRLGKSSPRKAQTKREKWSGATCN